ncbi:MAG TPA: DUF6159 family protein [Aggregatilineales bacterium]|nr:hypothetical protein [Anaerolineales bacterium]HRE46700.1 DUF6159 family protein [Aggregatilineales bacterium]
MIQTFRRSWMLVKASAEVLRKDPELLALPLISGGALIAIIIVFALPLFGSGLLQNIATRNTITLGQILTTLFVVILFYIVTYVIVVFSNAALVGAALIRLEGGNPRLEDGLKVARERFRSILGYGLMAGSVGMVMRFLKEERSTGIGSGVQAVLGGTAWGVATTLVIPILVTEKLNPIEALKRSVSLLRKAWGHNLQTRLSISAAFGIIALALAVFPGLPMIVIIFGARSGILTVLGATLLLLIYGALAILAGALSAVFQAALYRYATTGEVAKGFTKEDFSGAFGEGQE